MISSNIKGLLEKEDRDYESTPGTRSSTHRIGRAGTRLHMETTVRSTDRTMAPADAAKAQN
jgi:hypothetical protein